MVNLHQPLEEQITPLSHFIFAGTYMYVIHMCVSMCIHCNNDPYDCSPVWHHTRGRVPHFCHLSAAAITCPSSQSWHPARHTMSHWLISLLVGWTAFNQQHILQDISACAWPQCRHQAQTTFLATMFKRYSKNLYPKQSKGSHLMTVLNNCF